ncbi:hypothetical protein RA307_04805 [Xanthobacteraceae bacterium Astr-EGSB]|uniref:hypothetical protein n=1 Tax=Astrobacterium formosum TaxID=3069710 RepID=UPI0027B132F0|nr:hypothetical protein [Xanthobacteraceae bacterium Astr-EGSB]
MPVTIEGAAFVTRRPAALAGQRYRFVGLTMDGGLRAVFRLCDVDPEGVKRLNAVED